MASSFEDALVQIVFVAALFGLRKLPGKNPELWTPFWELHIRLGSPALPLTARWVHEV